MDEDILLWGFDALPKEIKILIFSFTDLDLPTVLRAQAVSSEFKKLCWSWLREYDTSLLSQKERTPVVAAQFITRLSPNLIRRINFSQYENAVESARQLVQKFPRLQFIEFGRDANFLPVPEELEQHPELREISSEFQGCYYKIDRNDHFMRDYIYSTETMPDERPFNQQKSIEFHRNYHRGGTIGEKLIVIGATDGTLTILTLDTVNIGLAIHSTKNGLHKNCINAIWSRDRQLVTDIIPPTYIASYDGIVTAWTCVDDKPELKQTFTLPEPIFFVSDFASSQHLLAAGKRTLYICDGQSAMIIREIVVDEDITGLFSHSKDRVLSTANRVYSINEDIANIEILHKVLDTPSPNLWLSPDISFRMTVHPNKIDLFEYEIENKEPNQDFGGDHFKDTYDARPHLARFSPTRYWMTVSKGLSIITYDLEIKLSISLIAPHVSRREKRAGIVPTCNALWYTPCGNYFFGLYSNNTLYWWHVGYY